MTVSLRPMAQGRSEGQRMHTARAREGGARRAGACAGCSPPATNASFSFFLPSFYRHALAPSWLCVFYPLLYFFHLCDLTRTYLCFACTLLHIHDTPAIIYICLLSRLCLYLTNLFFPRRQRCVVLLGKSFGAAERCRRALDHQRGLRVAEANAPKCRGFALYQPHDTPRLSSLWFPWSRSSLEAPNR
jgi:hypothetical protein